MRRIQDNVHGLMEFVGMEAFLLELLRSKELQRLRRIHQLGLAYFVFPGAEHSRFSHSIGTAYMALLLGRKIRSENRNYLMSELLPDEESIRDFSISALCHDLGHGPLSHAWEKYVIGKTFSREEWCRKLSIPFTEDIEKRKWHEIVTLGFLSWKDGDLYRILEAQEKGLSDRIRNILLGNYYLPYLPRMLSSDVDVDRMDYIARDTYCAGVKLGNYDKDWLLSCVLLGKKCDGEYVVGFNRKKAPYVIEQFLKARKALYHIVYLHRTVRAIEGMVGRFFAKLVSEARGDSSKLPNDLIVAPFIRMARGEAIQQKELLLVDDYSLWVLILRISEDPKTNPTLKDLAARILGRNVFKEIEIKRGAEADDYFEENPNGHAEINRLVKPHCPGEPDYYWFQDKRKFEMMSKKESERGYLVDPDSRDAIPMTQDGMLAQYAGEETTTKTIYSIREARMDIFEAMRKPS